MTVLRQGWTGLATADQAATTMTWVSLWSRPAARGRPSSAATNLSTGLRAAW